MDHYHCPCNCEHPQPFEAGLVKFCGRCWFLDGYLCEMVLCTPETCLGEGF